MDGQVDEVLAVEDGTVEATVGVSLGNTDAPMEQPL